MTGASLQPLWNRCKEAFLHFAYPQWCQICRKEPASADFGYVGINCQTDIRPITKPFCECCGQPDWGKIEEPYVCGECRSEPPHFSSARAGAHFDGVLREAIHKYKFNRALWVEPLLARHLKDAFLKLPPDGQPWDLLIPVPLHKNRRRHRQFNQAEQLARHLSLESKLPVENGALHRVVDSVTQTRLTRAARYENLKNAFAVQRPDLIRGKRLLLIDDSNTNAPPLWIGGQPTAPTSGPYNLQVTGSIYYTSTPNALAACSKATAAQQKKTIA